MLIISLIQYKQTKDENIIKILIKNTEVKVAYLYEMHKLFSKERFMKI